MAVFFIFIHTVHAFTLITPPPIVKFFVNEVVFNAGRGCSTANVGFDSNRLMDLVEESMNLHWNAVPTSALVLKRGEVLDVDTSSATSFQDSDLIASIDSNSIFISCSDSIEEFIENPRRIAGAGIIIPPTLAEETKGMLLINSHSESPVRFLSHQKLLALIAHEVGHTLGLGHSNDSSALMYYSLDGNGEGPKKVQEKLSQDDYDGLSYLYPEDDFLGSCGTLALVDDDDDIPWGGLASLSLGLALGILTRRRRASLL